MNTQLSTEKSTDSRTKLDLKLEVVILPVADVDRAKLFYTRLGWRMDADFVNGDWRVVQLTPPGSLCSVIFGKGITTAVPGSMQGSFLVVDDIKEARTELADRGVDVSEVFHFEGGLRVAGTDGRVPGPDPQGNSYGSWASFYDPDGNSWMLQEIKTRLPGRGFGSDATSLMGLLREAEEHHGEYEPTAQKHHWSEWYSAYIAARQRGRTVEEAAKEGALHVETLHR